MGWFVSDTAFGPTHTVFHLGASPDLGAIAAMVPSTSSGLVLLVNVGPRVAARVLPATRPHPSLSGWGRVDGRGLPRHTAGLAARPDRVRRIGGPPAIVEPAGDPARRFGNRCRRPGGASAADADLGWRQSWLWAPDLTVIAALVGAALAIASSRRRSALRVGPQGSDGFQAVTASPAPLVAECASGQMSGQLKE